MRLKFAKSSHFLLFIKPLAQRMEVGEICRYLDVPVTFVVIKKFFVF